MVSLTPENQVIDGGVGIGSHPAELLSLTSGTTPRAWGTLTDKIWVSQESASLAVPPLYPPLAPVFESSTWVNVNPVMRISETQHTYYYLKTLRSGEGAGSLCL